MTRALGLLLLIALIASIAAGQTSPPTFEDLSTRAQQAYEANHPAEALDLFRQAVKLKPDWAQGWWAVGMINYQLDHYPECRDALTQMVALDANAAPGWALLGLCEFRTKDYDPSFQHLKKAHMLVSVRQSGGELLDIADYHLAMLLTRQGAFEVAQEVMVKVALKVRSNAEMEFAAGLTVLRMPILPAEVPSDQRDVVTMAGKAFWDLVTQPPAQTEADFKALVSKYPKFPNVHYFYGTYLAAHFPERCAPEFLEELRISPDSVPARVQLALRYTVEGKLDDAVKMAREAVALSPDSVGAQLALADTLRAQGNDEAALPAFLAAERLDPVSPKIRLFLVNVYRALGRLDDMRREQAEYDRLKTEQSNWP
ncbi:MAG TPA: tetratricopeptide repeat protein [Dongiaceae bacterium]|nr:tetratricopeptide repeat protein [Dongiaceae bacterium]